MELSGKMGITQGKLSDLERGAYLPTAHDLVLLTEFLDCSFDWLLLNEGKNPITYPRVVS